MSNTLMCVTTFSDAGYKQYGKRMVDTFVKFWDPAIELMVFCDTPMNHPSKRVLDFPLAEFLEIQAFTDRHKNNPVAHGKEPTSFWWKKERESGYSFRFDAVRFHYSGMVPFYAAEYFLRKHQEGILIFLDGDTITNAPIDAEWIEKNILRARRHIAYLGRKGKKSTETGFVAYRLPQAIPFIKLYHDVYVNDDIFAMGETANGYIFDRVMDTGVISKRHNITPNKKRSHIWLTSPLAKKMTHLKGATNKEAGKQVVT